MGTKTPQELFAEACGLRDCFRIPKDTSQLLKFTRDFCILNDLVWGLESGEEFDYTLWISHQPAGRKGWMIDMEDDDINQCVITAVAVAWSNLHIHETPRDGKVVKLDDWKRR